MQNKQLIKNNRKVRVNNMNALQELHEELEKNKGNLFLALKEFKGSEKIYIQLEKVLKFIRN